MFDDLIGVPYQPEGRSLKGMDCWGLVLECCARFGITMADTQGWTDQEEAQRQQQGLPPAEWIQQRFPDWHPVNEPTVGCVVAFVNVDGAAVHVGIVTEPGYFLHVSKRMGVVLTRLSRSPWQERLCGIYAYQLRN